MRTAVVASLAVLATALSLPAAHAEVAGSSPTQTLYDGCHEVVVDVSGSQPGAGSWDLDTTLYAPSGEQSSSDYLYAEGETFARVLEFVVCAHEGIGVYRVEGELTWYDAESDVLVTEPLRTTLTMTRQPTRTVLKVSDTGPRLNSRVTMRMTSRQVTTAGWAANAYEDVALEIRCGRMAWTRVRGSRTMTDAYGRARLGYRWDVKRACRVRAVTLRTVNSELSRSETIRVQAH